MNVGGLGRGGEFETEARWISSVESTKPAGKPGQAAFKLMRPHGSLLPRRVPVGHYYRLTIINSGIAAGHNRASQRCEKTPMSPQRVINFSQRGHTHCPPGPAVVAQFRPALAASTQRAEISLGAQSASLKFTNAYLALKYDCTINMTGKTPTGPA